MIYRVCNDCGERKELDLILPIACGGEHNVKNLQLLAGILNVSKGANPHFQLSWEKYPK